MEIFVDASVRQLDGVDVELHPGRRRKRERAVPELPRADYGALPKVGVMVDDTGLEPVTPGM